MKTIEARGQTMKRAADALGVFVRNPMEVMTRVRANAIRGELEKVWAAWWAELDPVIRRHTGQPQGEPAKIGKDHKRWGDFASDEDAIDLLTQTLTVEIRPLLLSEIVAAQDRADRKDQDFALEFSGDPETGESGDDFLGLLMGLGIVRDDVSEDEPADEAQGSDLDEVEALLDGLDEDLDEAPDEKATRE